MGSRPNCSSTDAILLKQLFYDGLAILRKSAIIFNNDCKAAFDRMIPSVGGIALRRLGASTNAVSTLLNTLQQMRYKVRTSLGISEASFSNLNNWVLGTLQGSGASPCLWLAITCVLLGAMRKRSPGVTFQNPQGTLECNRIGEAYVDDTEFWLTIPDTDIVQLAKEMQDIAQHWEQLLYTTGGALALEKCFYVALEWSFPNDEHTLHAPSTLGTSIQLTSGNDYNTFTPIVQSHPSEGRRNLGAWIAPDGNNSADLQILCGKGLSMSINIAASHLQRHEVILAYKMMLQPAMKYTLSSTTLNTLECTQVDRSYLPTMLSHMGFNRNTKQLLLFGPPSLGAIGFTNTWTDQGIAQVQLFLGQIRKKEEIGLLLHIIMENLQLVIGSSRPLFTYPLLQVLKFCPRNWIINVWDFLLSINGTIQLEKSWHLETQRTNDLFLMDTIMNCADHYVAPP